MRVPIPLLAAALLAATWLRGQAPAPLELPALLERVAAPDWLWRPAQPGERCVQFSSHDRASDAGPADAVRWYANDDRGHYLRTVVRDGAAEFVLAEVDGPGCIARLWSANPSGTLHFDLDGERVWSVDFAALCSGALAGVPAPIAGVRARGATCYLPIPFAGHVVVSASAGDLYYAVDVVRWPAATAVATFHPDWLTTHAAAVAACAQRLAVAGSAPGEGDRAPALPATVPAGQIVDRLEVAVIGTTDVAARNDVVRRTRLLVTCGDERLVDVPLGDFFAGGNDWRPWQSLCLGIRADGSAYCRWPMPFPRAGRIELVTEGERAPAAFALRLATRPLPDPSPWLFRANYHLARATPSRPFSDHLVLAATGAGRFVGCSLLVRNPSRIWWGEGDEKFTVDGEASPSFFGTGTEDYFGYAWCEPTLFSAPFHAQIRCDGPMTFGLTQLHRTHLLDSVPFTRSFRGELERWHWVEGIRIDYATVAYWYGAPGATAGLPEVPDAAARDLPPLAAPTMFVAPDALEGELLRVVACSGGEQSVQDLGVFDSTFSRDAHRWWRGGAIGDALTLAVPVAIAGRYRVVAALVQAEDFGIVQVSLAGQPVGAPFDGYSRQIRSSGPREFGVISLPAGEVELRLELLGKNPDAKPGHMVGLDYLRLEKQP